MNYFVTCAHNLNFDNDEVHFIELDGDEVEIDANNQRIKIGDISNVQTKVKTDPDDLICFEPDYLIFELPEKYSQLTSLELRSSSTVDMEEKLKLVTHDIDTGDQIHILGKRSDLKESMTTPDMEIRAYIERTNMIRLSMDSNSVHGHSSGTVLDENNHCIGYLCRGGMNKMIYIFKSQYIPFQE